MVSLILYLIAHTGTQPHTLECNVHQRRDINPENRARRAGEGAHMSRLGSVYAVSAAGADAAALIQDSILAYSSAYMCLDHSQSCTWRG